MNEQKKIILLTQRLILRTWLPEDVPFMAAINSDPAVMEHFPSTQDLAATNNLILHINEHYRKYGYSPYAVEIKDTGEFIGFVGLNQTEFEIPNFTAKNKPIVEIAWRLSAKHWGKGYATEAAKAVIDYAFTVLKLNELVSFTVFNNLR